jgi:hypothetical protein
VVAPLDSPLAEARGKMEPLHSGGAHQPEGEAQDATIWNSGNGGGSLARRRGKVIVGVPGKFFYKSKSPSTSGTTSRIIPSTELKIIQECSVDLI